MKKSTRLSVTISFLSLVSLLSACVEDDLGSTTPLNSYNVNFMFYEGGVMPEPEPIVTIEFDAFGKVKNRTGGLLYVGSTTGYNYKLSTGIFDEVTMSGPGHTTILLKEDLPDFEIQDPNKREIFYQGGKIKFIVRMNLSSYSGWTYYDTTFFFYNSTLLEKTIRRNWVADEDESEFLFEEVKYFYYQNHNLVRIEGRKETWWPVITTTLELFEDYDTSPNPTKPLIIFDEVFYRSLSKNNFSKYSYQKKNSDGIVIEAASREWNLNYDDKGIPTFK